MACSSPNTQYKFEYRNHNVIGGTEATTGADCPPYDRALEAEAVLAAERQFKAYLDARGTRSCPDGCRLHTRTPWVPVPGLGEQVKLKRIFWSVDCPQDGEPRACLYSVEVAFYFKLLQRTVTCIPDLEGPHDFFPQPIELEKRTD